MKPTWQTSKSQRIVFIVFTVLVVILALMIILSPTRSPRALTTNASVAPLPVIYMTWVYRTSPNLLPDPNSYGKPYPMGVMVRFYWYDLFNADCSYRWETTDGILTAAEIRSPAIIKGVTHTLPIMFDFLWQESDYDWASTVNVDFLSAPGGTTNQVETYRVNRFAGKSFIPPCLRTLMASTISYNAVRFWNGGDPTLSSSYTIYHGSDQGLYWGSQIGNSSCYYDAGVAKAAGKPYWTQLATVMSGPKYDHPVLQKAIRDFATAFGDRYNNDGRLQGIRFGAGLDGEFGQIGKSYGSCDLKSPMYQRISEQTYLNLFVKDPVSCSGGICDDYLTWFQNSLSNKSVYHTVTWGGSETLVRGINHIFTDTSAPIGLFQGTNTPDSYNWWTDKSAVRGLMQVPMMYSTTVPIGWENAYGDTINPPLEYWKSLAALQVFPDFYDSVGGFCNPAQTSSINDNICALLASGLGKSITTTDEIWVAFRDTEWKAGCWSSGSANYNTQCGTIGGGTHAYGQDGNFEYGLQQINESDTPTVEGSCVGNGVYRSGWSCYDATRHQVNDTNNLEYLTPLWARNTVINGIPVCWYTATNNACMFSAPGGGRSEGSYRELPVLPGIARKEGVPRLNRYTNNVNGKQSFKLLPDQRWSYNGYWYQVDIIYLDWGTDQMTLFYGDLSGITKTIAWSKTDTRVWVTQTVNITDASMKPNAALDGAALWIDSYKKPTDSCTGTLLNTCDELLHKVVIRAYQTGNDTVTPTATPVPITSTPTHTTTRTSTSTATLTVIPSTTPTRSSTVTSTVTMTVMSTRTSTGTVTEIPTVTETATVTPTDTDTSTKTVTATPTASTTPTVEPTWTATPTPTPTPGPSLWDQFIDWLWKLLGW